MKSRMVWTGLILFVVLLVPVVSVFGQENDAASAGDHVLRLLRYMPDVPEVRESLVYYGDIAAWHASWNVPPINSLAALDLLPRDPHAYWIHVMPDQTLPPEPLGAQYVLMDDMRPFYGFDIFSTDRFITGGALPFQVTALDLRVEHPPVAEALAASGYEAGEAPGGTLYSFLDDYEVAFSSDVAVPRAGQMGQLNRIALVDDGPVVIARATADILAALTAAQGESRSLADDPLYVAAAKAALDPSLDDTGELVGLIWWFAPVVDDPAATLMGSGNASDAGEPLPPYPLVAFATRHTEGATYLILIVTFLPGTDAEVAADVLANRLQNYVSLTTQEPLTDRWTFDRAAAMDVDGVPVALVAMRVDDPPPASDDAAPPNTRVFNWAELIFRRDLGFLVSGENSE